MRQILTQLHILTSDLWPTDTGKNKVWYFKLKHHFVSVLLSVSLSYTDLCQFRSQVSAHNWIWLLAKLFITMNWKIKIFENNFMFCIYFTLLFLYFFPPNFYLHFLSFLNTFLFCYENGGYSKCVMRASINDWGLTRGGLSLQAKAVNLLGLWVLLCLPHSWTSQKKLYYVIFHGCLLLYVYYYKKQRKKNSKFNWMHANKQKP